MDHRWRKSRFSTQDNCVEVRRAPDGGVEVRDSQDPGGAVLHVGARAWAELLAGVVAGEFDVPGDRGAGGGAGEKAAR